MSDPLTPEELRAAIVAADAEVETLAQAKSHAMSEISRLEAALKSAHAALSDISGTWGRCGRLPIAIEKAARLRAELKASALPTVTLISPYGYAPTTHRVESIGPKRMRTTRCDFTRQPDGSWTSDAGTIAPFDEAAVKAAVKAAKEGADV